MYILLCFYLESTSPKLYLSYAVVPLIFMFLLLYYECVMIMSSIKMIYSIFLKCLLIFLLPDESLLFCVFSTVVFVKVFLM